MTGKPFKVQAVAKMLGTTVDSVRRMVVDAGIDVARQEHGPKTRLFSAENVFDLARYRSTKKAGTKVRSRKQVVATIYAPKGGVGKTTIAGNLACRFSLRGLKTLIVDIDFQGNLTMMYGFETEMTPEEAIAAGLSRSQIVESHFGSLTPNWPYGRRTLANVVKKPFGENGPHLVPADLTLDRLDTLLTFETFEGKNSEFTIARMLRDGMTGKDPFFDIRAYDIILFDAAPAKSRLTRGAILASDYVISPVSMEKFSTKALSYLSSVLTEMQEQVERSPELIIVGNFFDAGRVRTMGQLMTITQTYNDAWLDHTIRRSEDFPKALNADSDLPLVLAKPNSPSTAELAAVADALLERLGITNG
ncbi:Chromosome (plasmid) partitioning protein ParA [Candidatus Paraburkholderia calva]|nr:Chromosome (plasmid) partitioning protein ParA [Candidatus Paraburkholderia calva]